MNETSSTTRQRPAAPNEGVDELWSRLRDATKEARALEATNRQMAARVATLERQLAEAGALSDDELVAELPRRMSRALESAQEVAEELVGRAKKREESIRQKTDQRANALITHAEAEATAILRRAAAEAVGRVNQAKAHADSIARATQAHQSRVLVELNEQAAQLEAQVTLLKRQHAQLVRACEVVDRAMTEARDALRLVGSGGPVPPDSRDRSPAGPSAPLATPPLYAVPGGYQAVHDWSATVSGTA